MTSLAEFKRTLEVGSRWLCVEHDYAPNLIGSTRTFTRVGSSVCDATVVLADGTDHPARNFRFDWPKAAQVLDCTPDRLSYRLDSTDSRGAPIDRLTGKVVTLVRCSALPGAPDHGCHLHTHGSGAGNNPFVVTVERCDECDVYPGDLEAAWAVANTLGGIVHYEQHPDHTEPMIFDETSPWVVIDGTAPADRRTVKAVPHHPDEPAATGPSPVSGSLSTTGTPAGGSPGRSGPDPVESTPSPVGGAR